MSREQYQIPTATPGFTAGSGGFSSQTEGVSAVDASGPAVTYLCGDCNAKVPLKRGDPIRCKECGHRVLYKERTKRMVQFEAR
ncbi:MAG: DNA-directed RNA polymerase core subunit rpc10 [Caeruleum heppii]|nr:MAG: DNA-directed RNA polymerase core subunit rpc10 [Caeruleum heppii]